MRLGEAQTPAITFLGSYKAEYWVGSDNILHIHVHNVTTIESATRKPSKSGYSTKSELTTITRNLTNMVGIAQNYKQDIFVNINLNEY